MTYSHGAYIAKQESLAEQIAALETSMRESHRTLIDASSDGITYGERIATLAIELATLILED
jgi:hypothetical protein